MTLDSGALPLELEGPSSTSQTISFAVLELYFGPESAACSPLSPLWRRLGCKTALTPDPPFWGAGPSRSGATEVPCS